MSNTTQPETAPVEARNLHRGDVFRLRDGRRVEVMSEWRERHKRTFTVSLWEIDTDWKNFTFTLYSKSVYHVER
ncbi:hypothetical protein ACWD7M_16310 [Streptomyces griseus]